ncbi:MAG: TatD family hydrolase [Patescibacteria group bacterium]|nr:TatD family hydrolase [Patescibacteria group bacterium]
MYALESIVSFTGLITFSRQWDELIRKLPFGKFMVETDCPFMAPEPFRGQRNEPLFVKYTAKRIAEIKNIGIDKIALDTADTARKLFKI